MIPQTTGLTGPPMTSPLRLTSPSMITHRVVPLYNGVW
jgi:hypothetical protein